MPAAWPERYAPPSKDDMVERRLLAGLSFVGADQAKFCLNTANSIAHVRAELHRCFNEMAELDAKILGRATPAATAAAPSTARASYLQAVAPAGEDPREVAARREFIEQKMGTGAWGPGAGRSVSFDPRTGIQQFGVGVAR